MQFWTSGQKSKQPEACMSANIPADLYFRQDQQDEHCCNLDPPILVRELLLSWRPAAWHYLNISQYLIIQVRECLDQSIGGWCYGSWRNGSDVPCWCSSRQKHHRLHQLLDYEVWVPPDFLNLQASGSSLLCLQLEVSLHHTLLTAATQDKQRDSVDSQILAEDSCQTNALPGAGKLHQHGCIGRVSKAMPGLHMRVQEKPAATEDQGEC